MNRNRVIGFLAALGILAAVGVVVFLIFHEEPVAHTPPAEAPSTVKAPPPSTDKPLTAIAPAAGELAPSKPRANKDSGTLSAEGAIQGVVLTEAGVPIENATCELYEDVSAIKERTQEGELRDKQPSNSEGLFWFERHSLSLAQQYVLKVMHPLYVTERRAIDARKLEPVIYVKLKGGTGISGTVRTSAGAPVANATIQVFDMNQQALDPNGSVEGVAIADAAGAYTVVAVSAGIKRVQASMQGYATMDRQALQIEHGKPLANIDFSLNEGASISGQLFSTEGNAISGAFVTARPIRIGPKPDPAVMSSKEVEGQREAREQQMKDLAAAGQLQKLESKNDEDRKSAEASEMRVALMQKEREREAMKDPGLAKQRAVMQAAPATTNTSLTVRSKEDGTFLISGTEIGQYIVSVSAPGYVIPAQQTVESPSQGIVFTCAPNARIMGRVIDDETKKPVLLFSVGLTNTPDEVLIPHQTRRSFGPPKFTDGNFEMLDIRPGKYWLVADAPNYAGGRSEEVVVTQGERKTGIEIRLVRGATVRGRVLDSSGKPVQGALVQPEPGSMSDPSGPGRFFWQLTKNLKRETREARTGADGTFALPNMLGGSYTLTASHPDFGPATTTAFTVQGAGDVMQPDIILARGATIRGTIKNPDGTPDAKAMVMVTPMGNNIAGFGAQRTAYTNAEGRFELSGLAVGQYRIMVSQRAGQPDLSTLFTQMNKPNIITVGEGESKEIDL